MTVYAQWLDTTFAGFDKAILSMYHALAEAAGFVIGPNYFPWQEMTEFS